MQRTAEAVILDDENRILLEKRKSDEDNYAGRWAVPGGHLEKNESPEQTLIREMREELRIKITEYEFLKKIMDVDPTSKEIYEHNVFIVKAYDGKITGTEEEERLAWVPLDKADKITAMAVKDRKIVKEVLKNIRNVNS